MVATHDAHANHTEFQRITPTDPDSLTHDPKGSLDTVTPLSPSMAETDWRPTPEGT